jgi:uncharacterized protein YchJ
VFPEERCLHFISANESCIGGILLEQWRTITQVSGGKEMPNPNDKCPCGSGKVYKDCCGKGK